MGEEEAWMEVFSELCTARSGVSAIEKIKQRGEVREKRT